MKIDRSYEHEASIRDCLFHILYHWRTVLIAALSCAVLLGGIAFLTGRSHPADADGGKQSGEETQIRNQEQSNQLYETLLEEGLRYQETAPLMQVNPYGVYRAVANYTVVVDPDKSAPEFSAVETASAIAVTYPQALLSGVDPARLQEIYDCAEPDFINDMITGKVSSSSSSFYIAAYAETEQTAEEALEHAKSVVEAYSRDGAQQLGTHRIVMTSQSTKRVSDDNIRELQETVAGSISKYMSGINTNSSTLRKIVSAEAAAEPKSLNLSPVRLAAAGLFLGLIAALVLLAAGYTVKHVLRKPELFPEMYAVPVLGEFTHSRAVHPGKGIDRLIESLEFRNRRSDKAAAEGICALLAESGEKQVLLTGTVPEARLKSVYDLIRQELDSDTALSMKADFLNNSKEIIAAGRTEAVVLVEEKHVSRLDQIFRMAEILDIAETRVIGAVVC